MQNFKVLIVSTFIIIFCVRPSFCPKDESTLSGYRQNFDETIEQLLNEQINLKYISFYTYQTMANYFNKPTVGLMGFSKFFMGKSDEKLSHARSLTSYLNKRGGTLIPKLIYPELNKRQEINVRQETKLSYTGSSALEVALDTEKYINDEFLKIINQTNSLRDPNTKFFLKGYIMEEVESMNNLQILLSRLKGGNNYNIMEFLIDQELSKQETKL